LKIQSENDHLNQQILEQAKLISELKASKDSSDEQKLSLTEKINLLEAKLCEAESTILQKDA
jgi:hypothetical protein